MINIAVNNHEKARLRFYATYVASIVLILAIFFLLYRDKSASMPVVVSERTVSASDQYVKTAAFLHGLLKEQEQLYTAAVTGDKTVLEQLPGALKTAQTRLDSVMKNTAVSNDHQQAEFRQLYDDIQQLLQSRSGVVQDFLLAKQRASQPAAPVQQQPAQVSAAQNDQWNKALQEKQQQVTALQKQLLEERTDKEKRLAEMRNQLAQRQPNTADGRASGGSEWKQKYNTMKARHGELNTAYNSLSRAYQNVVADNKRLYGHIKSLQK